MTRIAVLGVLALLVALSGCATIDVPDGYVKLREPAPYSLKAVSADGRVLALRSRPNESAQADLAFWSQAVEHQKVQLDGLKLVGREEIRSERGLAGTLFTFELGTGQARLLHLIALYVTPQRIYTVEAAGPAPLIEEQRDTLLAALRSLRGT
jgi:hypothetical protein